MYIKATVKAEATKDSVVLRNDRYHITTREPAKEGRANESARELLARHLRLPQNSLSLIRGKDRPAKIFLVREK